MAPRILLTRPEPASKRFAAHIAPFGWRSVISPLTHVAPRAFDQVRLADAAAVIFTSANGVNAAGGANARTAYCVGPATARAAQTAGFAEVIDADGDARALIRTILRNRRPSAGRIVHVRGVHAAIDLVSALQDAGFDAEETIAYEAVRAETLTPEAEAALRGGNLDAAAFFSPRASDIFREMVSRQKDAELSSTTAFAISEAAAAPLRSIGFAQTRIADEPNGEAMRAAICGAA